MKEDWHLNTKQQLFNEDLKKKEKKSECLHRYGNWALSTSLLHKHPQIERGVLNRVIPSFSICACCYFRVYPLQQFAASTLCEI